MAVHGLPAPRAALCCWHRVAGTFGTAELQALVPWGSGNGAVAPPPWGPSRPCAAEARDSSSLCTRGRNRRVVELWKCRGFIPIAAIIITVHGNVTFPLSYSTSNPNSIPAGLGGWGSTECPTLVPPWHQNSLEGAARGMNEGEREMCQWLTPRSPVTPLPGAHPCPGTGADVGSLPVLG